MDEYPIVAEPPWSEGPVGRSPYLYRQAKETHGLILSWLAWLAVLGVDAYDDDGNDGVA